MDYSRRNTIFGIRREFETTSVIYEGFPDSSVLKNCQQSRRCRDAGSNPGLGRYTGEGNGNLFQYSCLENPMDRGACQATVHGVTKSQTRLSTHAYLLSMNDF